MQHPKDFINKEGNIGGHYDDEDRCIATKEGVFFEITWSSTVFGRYLLSALLMTKLVLRPFLLRHSNIDGMPIYEYGSSSSIHNQAFFAIIITTFIDSF
jgi:threonine/homoserine efflux transporter RhtA